MMRRAALSGILVLAALTAPLAAQQACTEAEIVGKSPSDLGSTSSPWEVQFNGVRLSRSPDPFNNVEAALTYLATRDSVLMLYRGVVRCLARGTASDPVVIVDSTAIVALEAEVDSLHAVIDSLLAAPPEPPPDSGNMTVLVNASLAAGETRKELVYWIHDWNGDGLDYICALDGRLRQAEPGPPLVLTDNWITVAPPCAVQWTLESCEVANEYELVVDVADGGQKATAACGETVVGSSWAALQRAGG